MRFENISPVKGHLLNDEQKKVKQKIMEELLDIIPKNISKAIDNRILNKDQEVLDLITSCLVMFVRESLKNVCASTNIPKKEFVNNFCDIIKNECSK